MTIQDLLNSIAGDASTVAADQAKLTADQAAQTTDDSAFASAVAGAGITSFAVPSADGNSVAVYTVAPNSTPPFTEVVVPTAQSIVLPAAAVAAAAAAAPIKP
jgi:type 1 fimbria pilin